jgi:hypothetical protein
MTLTLWRGRELLGEIHPRAPQAGDQLEGVLLVSPADPPLASLQQGHLPLPSGPVVIERPMEPDIAGRLPQWATNPGPVALRRRPLGEPFGISIDRQLRIEDEMGQRVETTSIMLLEHRPDPSTPTAAVAALPASALRTGSVWLVSIRLGAGPHAT